MSIEPIINLETGGYYEDHLIAKAFESLLAEFTSSLPQTFARDNWERARRIMQVEGRSTWVIVNSLRPFAKAQSSGKAVRERKTAEFILANRDEFPQLCRLIEKGLL